MFTRFAKCDLRPKILKKKHRRRSGGYVTEGYILRNLHSAPTFIGELAQWKSKERYSKVEVVS